MSRHTRRIFRSFEIDPPKAFAKDLAAFVALVLFCAGIIGCSYLASALIILARAGA